MSKNFVYFQPNEKDLRDEYDDCVIRCLCKVLQMTWLEVFDELLPLSRELQIPFNCRPCFEKYLISKGYKYCKVSNKKGSKRPTVRGFANAHKNGKYVCNLAHHIVAIVDGKYYDTYDSGDACLYGWWELVE